MLNSKDTARYVAATSATADSIAGKGASAIIDKASATGFSLHREGFGAPLVLRMRLAQWRINCIAAPEPWKLPIR
jgi:hypothetical protein